MGRKYEQTFPQRPHTNGQQIHEKMLHITWHQGNTNQNHNEIPPYTTQNGQNEQVRKQQILARMQRKGNPLTLLMGMQVSAATLKTVWWFLKKLYVSDESLNSTPKTNTTLYVS